MATFTSVKAWFHDHAAAILLTVAALQNSHLLGTKASAVLTIIQGMFSALGGT